MSTGPFDRVTNFAIAVILAFCFGTAHAEARNSGWTQLGERIVNDKAEYDTIPVGARKGRFTRLKLSVDEAPVEIKRLVVHFADGTKQVIERNMIVREDRRSPTVDLRGKRRAISQVVFYYEAVSRGWERARVTLYGRH